MSLRDRISAPGLLNPYAVPQGERRASKALLVPKIRNAVAQWRDAEYPGATDTTKRLLQYWFENDHKVGRGKSAAEFRYYFCQREAVETLIYLYEARRLRSMFDLARNFPPEQGQFWLDPNDDDLARYVFKMATGSGKTKVMSMAVVWSYLNAVMEPAGSEMPRAFLLIAPNVIVYERLKTDFEDGRIFREDPLIPPEHQSHWQFSVVLRDNPSAPSTRGALYLTNVQRLYDAPADRASRNESPAMTGVLGPRVRPAAALTGERLRDLVARHDRILVMNDEGHHLHDDDLEWAKVIAGLNAKIAERGGGVAAQLDFTATPKHQDGRLFREIVVDYPIADAVADGIVKKPILGGIAGKVDYQSDNASVQYRDQLTAGITKWGQVNAELEKSGKKPVLFIMAKDTKSADQIATWLEEQKDFAGRVLTIHTNQKGEVTEGTANQRELDRLREAAREVDSDANPFRAIVSVLMLREGWDVKNVVVIVPLRPYTAKAQILPEQTLGRGLRRMNIPGSGHAEQVIVIEHEAFKQFWWEYLQEEGMDVEWRPVGEVQPNFHAVYPDPSKSAFDVEIPILTPSLALSTGLDGMTLDEIDPLTVEPPQPGLLREDKFEYQGREMLSLEVVDYQEIERDFPADPVGYVNAACRLIERECRLTGQFHILAGLVKDYIERVLFGAYYSMDEEYVLTRLNRSDAKTAVFLAFRRAIWKRSVGQREVRPTGETLRLSETAGFEWSETRDRVVYPGAKTVFNLVACDNRYEAEFAQFLDRAPDIAAYGKNAPLVRFTLEYQNSQGALRLYYPDFIVRLVNGDHWLIETKGMEDVEVALKDARARQWARDASALSPAAASAAGPADAPVASAHDAPVAAAQWDYLKVPYETFRRSTAATFWELAGEMRAAAAR